MAKLRETLSKAGFVNARTYIASGNAMVDSDLSGEEIEVQVHDLIKRYIEPDLVVVVRTAADLQKVLDGNPFVKGYDISRVLFVLLQRPPPAAAVKGMNALDFGEEKVVIGKHAGYLYIPGSAARSKLTNNFLEKKLGVGSTSRNFKTISKLIELSRQ